MKLHRSFFSLTFASSIIFVYAQNEFSISDSINSFSLNLLATTIREAGNKLNIALSPYTVWTLMTIISEGAKGNTAKELEIALNIPVNRAVLRNSFGNLSRILNQKADGVVLEIANAIFTTADQSLNARFQDDAKTFYKVDMTPVNFRNQKMATDIINNYISRATRNRINYFVNTDDVANAQIFMASTFYLKGQWKFPFNKTATHKDTFYDDKGNKLGEVDMMYQVGSFPYYRDENLRAYTVELPYGQDGKMSMVVILPFKGENVINVLNLLGKMPFTRILDNLADAAIMFEDDETQVYLPKFTVSSSFNLNIVLNKLGIKDVFNDQRADLLGIFPHYLYLSRLLQNADIEVNEEGTVASAAAGASFINKSTPPKFQANRPFLYFIVDKVSRTIIFTGEVCDPKTLSNN